jgi:UDP-N-acetylglucosamine diphosphorylase/glucosamine-1-phosphate N-acetyltransferase
MNLIFFDFKPCTFYPFTLTRPASEIRVGILTIREKWLYWFKCSASWLTDDYLQVKYKLANSVDSLYVNGLCLPDEALARSVEKLKPGQKLMSHNLLIACHTGGDRLDKDTASRLHPVEFSGEVIHLKNLWDIFLLNDVELRKDFELLTAGRKSSGGAKWNQVENLFIEESATVADSFINTKTGPVYIGPHAEVMEGCMIRGPFALCEHAALKMGTKVYGATTLGPHCKAGGEVNNSVMFGFSNKAHDGFLGNSVIGEWCNLGADTNNSNLKNNYGTVKVWSYEHKKMVNSGRQFCGLFMGDFCKSGINTMFNTGTVAGVSANIFGADFPPKFIPSFSWGGASGFDRFELNKAIEAAAAMFHRRNLEFSDADKSILADLFSMPDC